MMIRKSRIRNVTTYLSGIPVGTELRPIVELNETHLKKLIGIGFSEHPQNGDTVLPTATGPITRFNADGKWQVHRDRPKEQRYVRTVYWTRRQWAGRGATEEHSDFRDIYRACYPRTPVAPPSLELTYVEHKEDRLLIAPPIRNTPENLESIRHAINLLLELFGECELVQTDLSRFADISVKRLHWRMLPPGAHPWERLHEHLKDVLKRSSENTQTVIFDRQQTILSLEPDEQYIGLGGFADYIAYVFKSRGFVVMESIRKGNAIYVFGDDWRQLSQLTKAEILSEHHHIARIVHTKGWKGRLARLLDHRDAA